MAPPIAALPVEKWRRRGEQRSARPGAPIQSNNLEGASSSQSSSSPGWSPIQSNNLEGASSSQSSSSPGWSPIQSNNLEGASSSQSSSSPGWSSMEVPLPSGWQQGKLLLSTKGTKESAGGAQGRCLIVTPDDCFWNVPLP